MNEDGFEEKLNNNIKDVAYLLNDEAKAVEIIKALKADMENVRSLVGGIEDSRALFLTAIGKTMNVFTDNPESRYAFVYNEFGLDAITAVDELAMEDKRVNDGESSRHGNSVSFEFISSKKTLITYLY